MWRWAFLLLFLSGGGSWVSAQSFSLEQKNDSLWLLVLEKDSNRSEWRLPYPVYRFQTGDVDGDGVEDAMVGVIKGTRFFPEKGRRLFIFKNHEGKVRPLWMGSKLGGILQDFRFVESPERETSGRIRSLETTADGRYVVAEYRWEHFGMGFIRFLIKNVTREEAEKKFKN